MSMIFFTYRGQTQARQGASILKAAGIPARQGRTPTVLAGRGCGYGLWVSEAHGCGAALELRGRSSPYERSYRVEGNSGREVTL